MNNETFGITFQYAICLHYQLDNSIALERTDKDLLDLFVSSEIIPKIFKGRKPIGYLSDSKEFTSPFIKKCPHNFLLANEETFSVRTFQGKVEDKIKNDIKKLGYEVNVTILNSADYYVPKKRERVIFIANRIGKKNFHPAPLLEPDSYITTKEAIADLVKLKDNPKFNHVRTKHNDDMKQRLAKVPEGKSLYDNYSDSWKKCPWNEASCTIKENHGGVNIHPVEPRVITVREMARLQSFPDDFVFKASKGKQMIQIGNAVPPFLAKAIALSIKKAKEFQ